MRLIRVLVSLVFSNYRLVSLLSIPSKILESEVNDILVCLFTRIATWAQTDSGRTVVTEYLLTHLKPGAHMPPKYLRYSRRHCLRYFSDTWGHDAAGNKKHRRSLPPACMRSWNVAGDFCSHIGTVSPAAPAAMSQVARQHVRTRLNGDVEKIFGLWKGCGSGIYWL